VLAVAEAGQGRAGQGSQSLQNATNIGLGKTINKRCIYTVSFAGDSGIYQIYGHIRCKNTVLANPRKGHCCGQPWY